MPRLTVVLEQLLAPVPGGTGRSAAQLTAALAGTVPPDWHLRTVTAWHRDLTAARLPGVRLPERLPLGSRVLAEAWRHGWASGRWAGRPWWGTAGGPGRPGSDTVHATTPLAPDLRERLVITVHDTVAWTHPETLTPRGAAWHRDIIGRVAPSARAVSVPSRAVADSLAEVLPAVADRITVVPHGVTPLPVPADAALRRARLGLPERYLLSVATLEPRKGLDVLLDAVGRLSGHSGPGGPALAVVGPGGWGGVDVPRAAAAVGIPVEQLHLLGRVDDRDLAAVLDGATVLVAPSRAEGFGLPVLEAFAAGTPVVCSDAPALAELAGSPGEAPAALVVPRGDVPALAGALEHLLVEPAARAELIARGRRRANDFDWERAARATWRLHGATPAG
ncbi:glycosyltransferase family 4 protein [Nakamurella leprariae]|uniref:Glycosyltransferase family 4 protein n=1 Tax=Nakamurella leprariae TaxID=2803911 RepID=A0A938YG21_9ACTN|nr:glycosyltransferase family 1 protein [Nakamurella leprariae]MBM9467722.1 glycosyltransferase family 4 protein [Nakamurella leprariae]